MARKILRKVALAGLLTASAEGAAGAPLALRCEGPDDPALHGLCAAINEALQAPQSQIRRDIPGNQLVLKVQPLSERAFTAQLLFPGQTAKEADKISFSMMDKSHLSTEDFARFARSLLRYSGLAQP